MKRLWTVFFLSIFDSVATVYLLEHGVQEINPLLKLLIGSPWFWIVKIGVTAIACVGINYLMKHARPVFSKAINVVLIGYAMLAVYELILIGRVS